MNKQQEFNAQIKRDNQQVVSQLLNDAEWEWLREFYKTHFEEIVDLLKKRNSRLVIEDFCSLDPSFNSLLNEHFLFVYQVNLAIQAGLLSQNMF